MKKSRFNRITFARDSPRHRLVTDVTRRLPMALARERLLMQLRDCYPQLLRRHPLTWTHEDLEQRDISARDNRISIWQLQRSYLVPQLVEDLSRKPNISAPIRPVLSNVICHVSFVHCASRRAISCNSMHESSARIMPFVNAMSASERVQGARGLTNHVVNRNACQTRPSRFHFGPRLLFSSRPDVLSADNAS